MNAQTVSVKIYMESQIVEGSLLLPPCERLSDFINSTKTFLTINDAVVYYPNEEQTVSKEIHINREAVQMIITLEHNTAKGVCSNAKNFYPYIQKMPSAVIINTSNMVLKGSLHLSTKERIDQLLAKDNPFLPFTEAKIRDNKNSWIDAGFIAINKKQIQSLMIAA
jgi:hypothetical protein